MLSQRMLSDARTATYSDWTGDPDLLMCLTSDILPQCMKIMKFVIQKAREAWLVEESPAYVW